MERKIHGAQNSWSANQMQPKIDVAQINGAQNRWSANKWSANQLEQSRRTVKQMERKVEGAQNKWSTINRERKVEVVLEILKL